MSIPKIFSRKLDSGHPGLHLFGSGGCALGLGLTLALSSAALAPASAQTVQVNQGNRTLSVSSTGTATELATRAVLSLGYVVYGPTSNAAYAKAAERSNAIAQALADAGVAKDHIESQSQSVAATPSYENPEHESAAEQAERRFTAQQSWTVQLPASEAAHVLALAVAAGANNSGNINWQVSDPTELAGRAAAKALANDKEMAASMAKGLGVTLGPLLYASNQEPYSSPAPRFAMLAAAAPAADRALKPLSIEPQRVSSSATVYAIFAIQ